MIEIHYNIRNFIKPTTQQVAVRVRWNKKTSEVTFITGVYADPAKWDIDGQKAKKSTTHIVGNKKFSAGEINERLSDFHQEIEIVFSSFSLKNSVPTPAELKTLVNRGLGREDIEVSTIKPTKRKSIKELLDQFFTEVGYQRGWDHQAKEKYSQAVNHLTSAVKNLRIDGITINTMYQLRDWYVSNGYKNRTISKQIVMLKSFLRWVNDQAGYHISDTVLNFTPNLKVIKKTVRFLTFEELAHFASYPFASERLSYARDMWCFMAYTSLRYSDLANLKTGHIANGRIEMVTQKTSDRITIPLTEMAQKILDRTRPTKDGYVFDVISNQKLNDAIKDAAKEAGLDRLIVDTYLIGTERKEKQYKFHEIISCHDARRTFVSCSLAMGIPPQIVMKATGHKTYKTMQPYIDSTTETQVIEMEKWNRNQYKSKVILALNHLSEEQLKAVLSHIQYLVG